MEESETHDLGSISGPRNRKRFSAARICMRSEIESRAESERTLHDATIEYSGKLMHGKDPANGMNGDTNFMRPSALQLHPTTTTTFALIRASSATAGTCLNLFEFLTATQKKKMSVRSGIISFCNLPSLHTVFISTQHSNRGHNHNHNTTLPNTQDSICLAP
jgi:hypothetical protein